MSLCHVGQVDELPSATMTLAAEEEAVSFLEKLGAVPEPTTEAADPRGPNKSWAVGQTGCGTNRRWFVLGYSLIFPDIPPIFGHFNMSFQLLFLESDLSRGVTSNRSNAG